MQTEYRWELKRERYRVEAELFFRVEIFAQRDEHGAEAAGLALE